MTRPTRILLTGAGGRAGQALRPILREQYDHVLLTDIKTISDCQGVESFQQGDISDFEFVSSLVSPSDGIVHLAGLVGAHPTFEESIAPNYIGTHNVFRAAVDSGIRNVVYASSHHTVGFMKRGEKIDHMTAPRPNSEYALSKAFGESAASYFRGQFRIKHIVYKDRIHRFGRIHREAPAYMDQRSRLGPIGCHWTSSRRTRSPDRLWSIRL